MSSWWGRRTSQRHQRMMLKGSSRYVIVPHCMTSIAVNMNVSRAWLDTATIPCLDTLAYLQIHAIMQSKLAPSKTPI